MILTTISAPATDCNTNVLRQMLREVFHEFNPFPIPFREVYNLWFNHEVSNYRITLIIPKLIPGLGTGATNQLMIQSGIRPL